MVDSSPQLIGCSFSTRSLRDELEYAARSDAKLLITGESGVGKEVVARLVHKKSARSRGPFIAINCAGIPDTLLESELFGHTRGSFTGAYRDKPGLLEMAHGGTIFMDEVGEMSLRMQALLLRFLETGDLQRVGAERRQERVNVRVIAATNRNLMERIASGDLREDLYYRLNVIHLTISPLRERREDIPQLLEHFVRTFAQQYGIPTPAVADEVVARLSNHQWPGNVRELRNIVERMLVRGPTETLTCLDLPAELRKPGRAASPVPVAATMDRATAVFERVLAGELFWSAVYEPFMVRDLTRGDLRRIVGAGLQKTNGSYKVLVELFNMKPSDYKRFLNFLRKHDCHLPFHQFRVASARATLGQPADSSSDVLPARSA